MDKKKTPGVDITLLFSPVFTGVLFVLFALAMAVATFVENDFGAASARDMIYNARWFELIFLLMVINMTGQIFTFKLYRRKKLTVLFFHLAFIIMIIGAAITRYTGYEGRVHIREGESTNYALSIEKYMGVEITPEGKDEPVYSAKENLAITGTSLGEFYRKGKIDGKDFTVHYTKYIPNATESVSDVVGGVPMAAITVTQGMGFRRQLFIREGDLVELPHMKIGFNTESEADLNITFDGSAFTMTSSLEISGRNMVTGDELAPVTNEPVALEEMMIYGVGSFRLVAQKLSKSAAVLPVRAENSSMTGRDAFELEIVYNGKVSRVWVYDVYNSEGTAASTTIDGVKFTASYGPERIEFPFSLQLEDFILARYPGSTSPSGYQSDVVLVDPEKGINEAHSIYMNNILKHRGFRFYQSSYDQDEKGTILSVNSDMAGMLVTYFGYGLMIFFIILSMLNRNSVFWKVTPSLWRNSSAKILSLVVALVMVPALLSANPSKFVYNKKKVDEFGKVLVQDQKGRTKPLYTVSNDILRKVSRKNSYNGYSPMQVFMGFTTDFQNWQDEPVIKISSKDLRTRLGVTGEYVAMTDLVNFTTGTYKLGADIEKVFAKPAAERSKMDKEILKVDERVNIIMMMTRGDFLRVFPLRDGTDHWGTPAQSLPNALHKQDSLFLGNILSLYTTELLNGQSSGDFSKSDEYLESIIEYQRINATYDLPSEKQVNAEVLYYRMLIFEKLFPFYSTVGIVMLLVLIVMIVSGKPGKSVLVNILSLLILGGFLFHTFGLGIRWYISGHSPMSNGYESLLFISWVTVLVGLGFGRKSSLTLAATAVLASLTLMVAHLSFMDPEITALVPVLKSYWLTLHVSVITASYGFLGLGAILGLVNMILYTLNSPKNRKHALSKIDELSVISYRSLTFGLYFLTIGTFLGAVWANESWGRYWGWDPKETWSLITMIVYAFVLHAKNIKGLNTIFAYNVMSVYAFSSVLMTYFGVNYYLSGLHSYAGGDPVPVPSFVYYTIVSLIILTVVSYRKYSRLTAKIK